MANQDLFRIPLSKALDSSRFWVTFNTRETENDPIEETRLLRERVEVEDGELVDVWVSYSYDGLSGHDSYTLWEIMGCCVDGGHLISSCTRDFDEFLSLAKDLGGEELYTAAKTLEDK